VNPWRVLPRDLNGDGRMDLAVAAGGGLNVLLGLGDGTFAPATGFLTGENGAGAATLDANVDGRLDFVVANAYGGTISLVENRSAMIFPADLPDATLDQPILMKLTTIGTSAAPTFEINEGRLPTGLALSDSGQISGTPEEAGRFSFRVRATAGTACAERIYALRVTSCRRCPRVVPPRPVTP
jgi:FG-GAP-like repeat/Putative Ig domain